MSTIKETEETPRALLYQISIFMQQDEDGDNGIMTEIECTDNTIALRNQFDGFREIEELFVDDISEVSQYLAENLGILEESLKAENQ